MTYNLNYDKFNNLQQASVGSNTLATYTYGSSNGSLSRLTYGNGDYIDYLYNAYGSTSEIKQNGTTAFKWYTDNSGNAVRHIDNIAGREYNYNYDTSGRLIGETIKSNIADSIMLPFARVSYAYDLNNNVSSIINVTGNKTVVTDYEYGLDNLPDTVKINNDKTESFTYDSLNRLTSTNIDLDNDITTSYTYKASDRNTGNSTVYQTTKIETETIGGKTYKYSYDSAGNITNIYQRENNIDTELYRYVYDSFSQLVTDIDFTALIRTDYTYDSHGNITNVLKSNINQNGVITSTISSVAYQYNDSTWADKLTSYNGSTITYDAIGNPLSYRNNMTMTWQNGRELATLTKGSNSVSYTYGADGNKKTKTVNGNVTKYEYAGDQLLYENTGYRKIYYVYDSNGNVLSAIYKASQHATEQTYYYAHNWRGDVVALYDSTGALFATYDYDAWGKLLSVKDANGDPITGATSFAIANPFRYRGYYYDRDSGLYYLQSRYYDPTTGRFVNADALAYTTSDSFIGLNLFAYAENNSINNVDATGNIAIPLIKIVEIAGVIIIIAMVGNTIISATKCSTAATRNPSITYASPFSLPKITSKEKELTKVIPKDPPKKGTTYYHVTTRENANKIISKAKLGGSGFEGGYVYAWKKKPSNYAIRNSGAHFGVIISFKTNATFVPDTNIKNPIIVKYGPVRSARSGTIAVWDVKIIGVT